jgi:hypothetical protein
MDKDNIIFGSVYKKTDGFIIYDIKGFKGPRDPGFKKRIRLILHICLAKRQVSKNRINKS